MVNSNNHAAIILGGHYGALSIARSLGRQGIAVHCHDQDANAVAYRSKYVSPLARGKDKPALLAAIDELARRLDHRPVLYISADTYLEFVAEHLETLQRLVVHPYGDKNLIAALLDKVESFALFTKTGIPTPATWLIDRNCGTAPDGLPAPMVIKPIVQTDWTFNRGAMAETGGRKALFIDEAGAAARQIDRLTKFGPMIVQEFIPGGDGDLFYFVGYRDPDGTMLVSFSGRKMRTLQNGMGSETVLQSDDTQEVVQLGRQVFSDLDITGVAGVDIKRDPLTGRLYVIEVNYRFGLSDGIVQSAGVDLAMIYFRRAIGKPLPAITDYRRGVIWIWFEHEISHHAKSLRSLTGAVLAFGAAALRGSLNINEFNWLDPMPFISMFTRRVSAVVRKGGEHA